MHASEFLWPLNSTKTLSSFRKLDQTTFKRLKCNTLCHVFATKKLNDITCGLSTSAGNLLTFLIAVCNNRPVQVIGRVGKWPEITVVHYSHTTMTKTEFTTMIKTEFLLTVSMQYQTHIMRIKKNINWEIIRQVDSKPNSWINIIRIVRQTVRRISIEILGIKGWRKTS